MVGPLAERLLAPPLPSLEEIGAAQAADPGLSKIIQALKADGDEVGRTEGAAEELERYRIENDVLWHVHASPNSRVPHVKARVVIPSALQQRVIECFLNASTYIWEPTAANWPRDEPSWTGPCRTSCRGSYRLA